MELLIPAVITILAEAYKRLEKKVGVKAKSYVLIVVFALSVVATGLYQHFHDGLQLMDVQSLIQVWGLSVGYYELIVKKVLSPIFAKSK